MTFDAHCASLSSLLSQRVDILQLTENDASFEWDVRRTCWAHVEQDAKLVVFSIEGMRSRGAKVTIRADKNFTLHEALCWNGQFLLPISVILSDDRSRQAIDAALCESVTLTAKPQSRIERDSMNRPKSVEVPSFTFPGVLTEKYVRNDADDIYRAETQQRVLITSKLIVLRPGDLVQNGEEQPYTVRQVFDLAPYQNEYVMERRQDV